LHHFIKKGYLISEAFFKRKKGHFKGKKGHFPFAPCPTSPFQKNYKDSEIGKRGKVLYKNLE
jgi:hypothetical protein